MPIHVEVYLNNRYMTTVHIGREMGTDDPDSVNTYRVLKDSVKIPQKDQWEEEGIQFQHRYGDGIDVCIEKGFAALNAGKTPEEKGFAALSAGKTPEEKPLLEINDIGDQILFQGKVYTVQELSANWYPWEKQVTIGLSDFGVLSKVRNKNFAN